jgi:hypothetical protein
MAASDPLPEPRETFCRLLARGSDPVAAYSESRIGVEGVTVDQAKKLPGVWARVEWLKRTALDAPAERQPEDGLSSKTVRNEHVIDLLIRDHAIARQMGQMSAAVKCAELIGKEKGMFVERKQIDVSILDRMELHEQRALLEAIEVIGIPVAEKSN